MRNFLTLAGAVLVVMGSFSAFAAPENEADLERMIGSPTDSKYNTQKESAAPAKTSVKPVTATTEKTPQPAVEKANVLRLTPDKTHILRLDRDAASVIVANPAHATVMLDTARTVLVMPRAPGSTSLTVLDNRGEVILEQSIAVGAAQKSYIRVRKACSDKDSSCVPSSYFYCPDGCYEVTPVQGMNGPANVPEVPGNAAAARRIDTTTPPPALPGEQAPPDSIDTEDPADGEDAPATDNLQQDE